MSEALSKTAMARRYESMRSALRRVREDTKHAGRVGTSGILTAAGGAMAGFTAVKFPVIPGTSIPTDAALGVALLTGAALDMFEGVNDQVASFAGGLLAVATAREVQQMVLARK